MVTHDNIYIPGESFPHWIWFVIEFVIVLGVAIVITHQIVPTLEDMVLTHNWVCIQVSHLSQCPQEEELAPNEGLLNWIFWGIVTAIFLAWYIVIRGFILKKPILKNRNE